jgi:hypothetical protein
MDAIIIFVRITIWSSVIHIYDGSSGLFSGSVAAFNIYGYRRLSSDSGNITAANCTRVETLTPLHLPADFIYAPRQCVLVPQPDI